MSPGRPAARASAARLLAPPRPRPAALTLWTFQANVAARAFYIREGFSEVETSAGEGNDEGLPDVRLDWLGSGSRPPRRLDPHDIWGALKEWALGRG